MERPAYYAIIPAHVRYDERICPNAKLLYGEITALCGKTGACWASNAYFEELYGVSGSSIKRWIKALKDNGYITSTVQYAGESKEVIGRYICLAGTAAAYEAKLSAQTEEGEKEKKPKKKEKKESNLELFEKMIDTYQFADGVRGALEQWIRYKTERKDKYQETGMRALLARVKKCVEKYGEEEICEVIEQTMASGYAGIVWDWIEKKHKTASRYPSDRIAQVDSWT